MFSFVFYFSEHSIIKALINHYANVQTESKKALEEVDKRIWQDLQFRKPGATVDYESFMEKLEESEDARRTLLAEKKELNFTATPNIPTHTSSP